MSGPRPLTPARRLFGVVQRERPSAELRARILSAGHAELERAECEQAERGSSLASLPARERRPEPLRELAAARKQSGARSSTRLWLTAGVLSAAAAGLIAYLTAPWTSQPGVIISAEHSGPVVLERGADRATTGAAVPQPPARDDATPASNAQPATARALPPAPPRQRVASTRPAMPPTVPSTAPPSVSSTVPPTVPSTAPPQASLAAQLEQIRGARTALRAGDHQRALELSKAYLAQPRGGELAAEASLIQIEALASTGQRDAAARAARQFAIDYPNSPLIDRALSYAADGAGR